MDEICVTQSEICTLASGLKLSYEVFGLGPHKILFIMGLFSEGRSYAHQVAFFKKCPEFQFCVYDNRGVGRSDRPWGIYTTSLMAHDALELVNHLGWQFVHVVGVSMGGMIAQEFALSFPSRVRSLSLIVTHAGGPFSSASFEGASLLFQGIFIAKTNESRTKLAMKTLYTDKTLEDVNRHKYLHDYHMKRRAEVIPLHLSGLLGQYFGVNSHHVSFERLYELKKQSFPVFIIGTEGKRDKLVSGYHSHVLQQATGGKLWVSDSGHGVIAEQHDEVNEKLKHFFLESKPGHFGKPAPFRGCAHKGTCWFDNVKFGLIAFLIGKVLVHAGANAQWPYLFALVILFWHSASCVRKYFTFMIYENVFSGIWHIPFASFFLLAVSLAQLLVYRVPC